MDRPALNGFEIVEQLEKEFGLQSYPINWYVQGVLTSHA
jgi:peptide chain release factor 3